MTKVTCPNCAGIGLTFMGGCRSCDGTGLFEYWPSFTDLGLVAMPRQKFQKRRRKVRRVVWSGEVIYLKAGQSKRDVIASLALDKLRQLMRESDSA